MQGNEFIRRMNRFTSIYQRNGIRKNTFGGSWGCDYFAPRLIDFPADTKEIFAKHNITWEYSIYSEYFQEISSSLSSSTTSMQHVSGERPNLWWAESAPNHHFMFIDLKNAARALSEGETWLAFASLLAGADEDPELERMRDISKLAWQNMTIMDHGLGHKSVPLDSLPRTSKELDFLMNKNTPPHADEAYREKWKVTRTVAEELVEDSLDYAVTK